MPIDKNLFLHDLSIVAILKNEGPYLKEWLDYHLLAGVDHFYLYDNASPDNQAEVVKPYVEAGLVDYFSLPGKMMQHVAYNDAIRRFKFFSRYIAFIDGDEFIYLKNRGGAITEVVDEILSKNLNAGGLAIHWQCFGSNGQEKADYSRGVLERFTRRAPKDWAGNSNLIGIDIACNRWIKNIVCPRKINFFQDPHSMIYFEGVYSIDERSVPVAGSGPLPIVVDKIVVNHYHVKSREEYRNKRARGRATEMVNDRHDESQFRSFDHNEEFDDDILKYREARAKIYQPPDKSRALERLFNAAVSNLSPTLLPTTPPNFYKGKMETFLTCRAVASFLKTKLTDEAPAKFFEEASLKAIFKSFNGMSTADLRLLIRELPDILSLPYPVANDIRSACLQVIPQMMEFMHFNKLWKDYVELEYLQRLLQTWKPQ